MNPARYALPLLLAYCLGNTSAAAPTASSADTATLRITGSSTMAPMVAAMARRFERQHPGVRIEVSTGGSGRGLSDVRSGKSDIGMVSHVLSDKESDLNGFTLARDGIAIVLNKKNPIDTLTDQQIADIYTGKITHWKTVGGGNAPINVIVGEKGRSSVELFGNYFSLKDEDIKATKTIGDNALRISAVVSDVNAIIYMSIGETERKARAGLPIKALPVSGVAATVVNLRHGEFPISRALTVTTKGLPTGWAKAFIDFCLSPGAVDIVTEYDFIPYLD